MPIKMAAGPHAALIVTFVLAGDWLAPAGGVGGRG
jgi:hypothetical protein